MWDILIVTVIVAAAALFIGRRAYKQFRGRSSCGCGCGDGCSVQQEIRPATGRSCGCDRDNGSCSS